MLRKSLSPLTEIISQSLGESPKGDASIAFKKLILDTRANGQCVYSKRQACINLEKLH